MRMITMKGASMYKKRISVVIGTIFALASVFLSAHSVLAWGPEGRQTYTIESPAPYAVFNSITNNNAVGDERNFVRIGEAGSSDPYRDEIEIVPGKEYEVYIYYHNDAASNTNESGYGVATGVTVASAYPTVVTSGERGMVSGIITWSYVTPESPNNPQIGKVWDEAYVTTKADSVVLRYKPGTATIHNSGATNGKTLASALFTEAGTLIGFNKLGGTLPGCAEYSGHITYTLVAEKIDTSLTKQVSTDGETWDESVTVKPGDYVTYKVAFENTGNTNLTNVILQDSHDEGLSLRPGSTTIFDLDNQDGKVIDDILDISGYNFGDKVPNSLIQIVYQAKVAEDDKYCGSKLKNTITAKYNSTEQITDDAMVVVACEDTPAPNPGTEPDNPTTKPDLETPDELPNTGPLEITLAIVIIVTIAGVSIYYWRTHRTLKTVEDKVSGKNPSSATDGIKQPEEATKQLEAKPSDKSTKQAPGNPSTQSQSEQPKHSAES